MSADSPDTFRVERVAVRVGPRDRWALVCVPRATPPATGWPVVLAFHGGRSHPGMMRGFSGLDVLAAAGRALVVYPAGTGTRESMLTWNGGNCCGEARDGDAEDVGFARELVALLGQREPIDRRRIHATGMSNGAMMAYRLGRPTSWPRSRRSPGRWRSTRSSRRGRCPCSTSTGRSTNSPPWPGASAGGA
jgi:polyhydroxybutyrate depolymerase